MRRTLDSKRRAALTVIVFGLVLGLYLAVAMPAGAAKGVVETQGPVYGDKCSPCHANIGTVIIPGRLFFKHAFHILVECSACHTDFPHKPDRTSRPPMKTCWACHKLTHSAGGEIARGNCSACHPKEFIAGWSCPFEKKVKNWKGRGHAKLGKLLQKSECAMCHPVKLRKVNGEYYYVAKDQFCAGCHKRQGVKVSGGEKAYDYDEGMDCLVCHQVKTLSKNTAKQQRKSFFIEKKVITDSVHSSISCQGCHSDFNFRDRGTSAHYGFTASLACEGCHDKQKAIYTKSIHGDLAHKGRQTAATCGACHGGHDIFKLDEEGKAKLSTMSEQVCGDCHKERYKSYDDYYHGAAYKTGAPDAPNCWTCHGAHDVLPSKFAASKTSSVNLAKTCSACKPHDNAAEDFTSYAKLIHRTKEIKSSTFISQIVDKVRSWIPF
ncbi:MAG: hypothetical protein C4521_06560 [Actinobacteria bacterium]|nr:MAG: hypothetical protein C4521_06560 [Actinomycetota bacterium]